MANNSIVMTLQPHGLIPDGREIDLYVLRSASLEVRVSTFGARLVDLRMRAENGEWGSVILGFPTLKEYVADSAYMGAIVGRFANRIAHGRFTLKSKLYELSINDGANSLHGGQCGFDQRVWGASVDATSVTMHYESASGEEGYPGTLWAQVRYTLAANELRIAYEARSTADTPVNLSNHTYFNLGSEPRKDVLSHVLTLHSNSFTPVNSSMIPTGEVRQVSGTAFDFREPHTIGERINDTDPQLQIAEGYDHNWILAKNPGEMGLAAHVYDPQSERMLTVLTTEPGIQFYTGNQLPRSSSAGRPQHAYRCGFCLETQHFPDSPNHPNFPGTILQAGKVFKSRTTFRLANARPIKGSTFFG